MVRSPAPPAARRSLVRRSTCRSEARKGSRCVTEWKIWPIFSQVVPPCKELKNRIRMCDATAKSVGALFGARVPPAAHMSFLIRNIGRDRCVTDRTLGDLKFCIYIGMWVSRGPRTIVLVIVQGYTTSGPPHHKIKISFCGSLCVDSVLTAC